MRSFRTTAKWLAACTIATLFTPGCSGGDVIGSAMAGAAGADASGGTSSLGGAHSGGASIGRGGANPGAGGASAGSGGIGPAAGGAQPATGGVAGAIGSGGAGGAGQGCACPDEPLTWGISGDFAPAPRAMLDCTGFSRILAVSAADPTPHQCALPNDRCYPEWEPELNQVLALLQSDDVQQAVAAAPVVYGNDPRLVDGSVFEILIGDSVVDVGGPCSSANCVEIPAGVQELADALRRLERHAALECLPECQPTPPVSSGSCAEPLYYWMYGRCEQTLEDHGCDSGYATEAECVAAHRECQGLYTHDCGGGTMGTCDADEYCAYRSLSQCGTADGGAVCLPKPRRCMASAGPVCGCDNKTYPGLCEAAQAGTGELHINACGCGGSRVPC